MQLVEEYEDGAKDFARIGTIFLTVNLDPNDCYYFEFYDANSCDGLFGESDYEYHGLLLDEARKSSYRIEPERSWTELFWEYDPDNSTCYERYWFRFFGKCTLDMAGSDVPFSRIHMIEKRNEGENPKFVFDRIYIERKQTTSHPIWG